MKPSIQEIKAFQRKIRDIYTREAALNKELKREYESLLLNADDAEAARRAVCQAYFQTMKERDEEIMLRKLEFHPFFMDIPQNIADQLSDEDEDDE